MRPHACWGTPTVLGFRGFWGNLLSPRMLSPIGHQGLGRDKIQTPRCLGFYRAANNNILRYTAFTCYAILSCSADAPKPPPGGAPKV